MRNFVYLGVRRPLIEWALLQAVLKEVVILSLCSSAPPAVALQDGEICRKTLRRMGMLDRLSVFDDDIALQPRVEELLARLSPGSFPRAAVPSRAELVRAASESLARVAANN